MGELWEFVLVFCSGLFLSIGVPILCATAALRRVAHNLEHDQEEDEAWMD